MTWQPMMEYKTVDIDTDYHAQGFSDALNLEAQEGWYFVTVITQVTRGSQAGHARHSNRVLLARGGVNVATTL